MADEYKYLVPAPDQETKPYWDAAKQHELRVQQCSNCKTFRHPPTKMCSNCYSEESQWVKVSGKGKLYSFINIHQPVLFQWRDDVPYNVVQVQLDEDPGIIVVGNVPGVAYTDLKVGAPVKVIFDDVTDEITMPRWALA